MDIAWRQGGVIEDMAIKPRPDRRQALDETRLRQQVLGEKLRQMFNEVASEPVPDAFLEILRRAEPRGTGDE